MFRVWYSTESLADYIIDKTDLRTKECTKKKMFESDANNSNSFHTMPDHIKQILYLDAPQLYPAAARFEAKPETVKQKLGEDYCELLEGNIKAFEFATIEDIPESMERRGRDSATGVLRYLRGIKKASQFTEDQENYIRKLISQIEEGGLPKQTTKKVMQELKKANTSSPMKILGIVQMHIPREFTESHYAENSAQVAGPREVILSEYLIG